MTTSQEIIIGYNKNSAPLAVDLRMTNRHGLIAGATGTGKTVTLQHLAESFSRAGVSVFTVDVKGDLSGMARAGGDNTKVADRVAALKITGHQYRNYPVIYWDLYGKRGHPLRATISELGPVLLSRLLDLNPTQDSVLQIVFKIADDQGLLLLDLKDLRAAIAWISYNATSLKDEYGNLNSQTLATIQRNLLTLAEAGGEQFFGEPALQLQHLTQCDFSGNGAISVLDATTLLQNPRVYSTCLLWILSELFEQLDEVGDREKPRLVLFFDEAHLLFKDTPKALIEKIEQVVRLIRSKGVGVYFVTQNPLDIPDTVLGQLGNRVQHALRAFTPSDQKAVRAAAQTFRQNPEIDTEKTITELEVGEALVSVLDQSGRPTIVERILIAPPESRVGPLSDAERAEIVSRSPLAATYTQLIDRESAFEILKKRKEGAAAEAAARETASIAAAPPAEKRPVGRPRDSLAEAMFKSMARSVGSSIGRQILRGVMGSIMGGR